MSGYEFTNEWFANHWENWLRLTAGLEIRRILEIGSFEGRSACTLIDHFGAKNDIVMACIDTWSGSVEHQTLDMSKVEQRFDKNIAIAIAKSPNRTEVWKMRGESTHHLSMLIARGYRGFFDIVFVDGSHQAADVLSDCVLGYHLCRSGGLIICDDYLWSLEKFGEENLYNMPKLGIDAFSLGFTRRLRQLPAFLYQTYYQKL